MDEAVSKCEKRVMERIKNKQRMKQYDPKTHKLVPITTSQAEGEGLSEDDWRLIRICITGAKNAGLVNLDGYLYLRDKLYHQPETEDMVRVADVETEIESWYSQKSGYESAMQVNGLRRLIKDKTIKAREVK